MLSTAQVFAQVRKAPFHFGLEAHAGSLCPYSTIRFFLAAQRVTGGG